MQVNKSTEDSYLALLHEEGISPPCEIFYVHSLDYSASRCLEAFERYEDAKKEDSEPELLISNVQEAIGHAASLSRYFWPSPRGKKSEVRKLRGKKLRKAFMLSEASPLYDRELRNAWEHFDERLDDYMLENLGGLFLPVSAASTLEEIELVTGYAHIFKMIVPQDDCLILLGGKYFFAPIKVEVERVSKLAKEIINGTGRLEKV